MILSDTINQRYRYNTQGKTPTQIQQELRKLGVNGFVVKVAGSRVTLKVSECDIKGTGSVYDRHQQSIHLQSNMHQCCGWRHFRYTT